MDEWISRWMEGWMDGRIAEQRGWCVGSFKSEASHSQTPRGTLISFFLSHWIFWRRSTDFAERRDCSYSSTTTTTTITITFTKFLLITETDVPTRWAIVPQSATDAQTRFAIVTPITTTDAPIASIVTTSDAPTSFTIDAPILFTIFLCSADTGIHWWPTNIAAPSTLWSKRCFCKGNW